MKNLRVFVLGTDTDIGKTYVTKLLVTGLRELGRKVHIHKPVACGGWEDGTAEDYRDLLPFVSDGQDETTLCSLQFSEAVSPHIAARLEGVETTKEDLIDNLKPFLSNDDCDLVIESAGGVLSPLCTDYSTIVDLIAFAKLPVVLVTRPHLGTLNHTALTIECLRSNGFDVLGIVVNYHDDLKKSIAVKTAKDEIEKITGVKVLKEIYFSEDSKEVAKDLAENILGTLS